MRKKGKNFTRIHSNNYDLKKRNFTKKKWYFLHFALKMFQQ